MADFDHGATDSGSPPLADFSSCAHPFGPCPSVLDAVRNADFEHYPDPSYAHLRSHLAARSGADPSRIVPGTGASELVLRTVRCVQGDVLAWNPSFVEYRRAAHVCDRRFHRASDPGAWLDAVPQGGVAFLCQPNNPDGRMHDGAFLREAARVCRSRGTRLVLDLAYADFCHDLPELPPECDLLRAPNKKFGLVGIRAGYMACADRAFAEALRGLASSWAVGADGVAFLRASVEPEAEAWFVSSLPAVHEASRTLREALADRGWIFVEPAAHFFAARPPHGFGKTDPPAVSLQWTRHLRERGIRVRDLSNTGLPGWLRFSARPDAETALLVRALDEGAMLPD
jgi:histidinol-phosphate aminotransferase